jgi:DNA repair exonuclease SbcCD ATPase subunit
MALTGRKTQRGGWQQQADRLALNHTAVATTAMAAAEQARHRTASNPVSCHRRTGGAEFQHRLDAGIIGLAYEPHSPHTKLVGQEQQLPKGAAVAWLVRGPRETLAARAARATIADKRATELENDLSLARERLALEENEKHSLQMSLDLTISEYSHLSNRLAESEHQVEKLAQLHSKLLDDTNTLLKTCKARDAALARAEERLSLLADLFVQLEAANLNRETIAELNSRLQHELNNDKWLLVEPNMDFKKSV